MKGPILIHVQHLLGTGHQRRAAALARALSAAGLEVCYVSGGALVPGLELGSVEYVQLPPARAADSRYRTLVDADGRPVDEHWRQARRARLLETYRRVRPAALVVETFPFGRRLLRFELVPLLERARAERVRPLRLSSVRDILEPRRKPGRNEEAIAWFERYFDFVLVHGDPRLVPLEASFPLAAALGDRVRYTGYVVDRLPERGGGDNGEVLVSAGGGAAGERLLGTALAARARSSLARAPWRLIGGSNLPAPAFAALAARAPRGVTVERHRGDFLELLARCRVSVSQAGYNTAIETLLAGARAVLVPFAEGQEVEQVLRAERLAARGLVETVAPQALDARSLARAVDRAAERDRPPPLAVDTNGAEASARLIQAWLKGGLKSAGAR